MWSDDNYAQVLYDFVGNFADELSVKTGEILQILYEIDQDWVYVKSLMINYQLDQPGGIVPKNHLKPFQIPSQAKEFKLFVAINNFGEQNNDLYFLKNDLIISNIDNHEIDENWLYGYLMHDENKRHGGMFPLSFVKQVYLNDEAKANTNNNNYHKYENIYEPKQAKAIYSFESTSRSSINHSFSYLKFEKDEYLLITDSLDENWLIGEKLNGDKGLIPINYIEFIAEQEPIVLNRTQRTFFKDLNQPLIPLEPEQEPEPKPVLMPKKEEKSYCRVNFDFQPENDNELGCLSGEILRIIKLNPNDEWIQVENKYGKIGITPYSFVTVLDTKQQQQQQEFKNLEITTKNNELEHKIFSKIENNKNLNGHRPPPAIPVKSSSATSTTSNRKSINKPPIAPKPILINRPVVYNNELLNKIKHLESVIEKQNSNIIIETTTTLTADSKKVDENNSSLECLKNDLTNMKNLFVESAQSRQLAMAQIDVKEKEIEQKEQETEIIMHKKQPDETVKLQKKQIERELTINELFETELIYLSELTAFYDAFITNCLEYPQGFNRNILFDELKNVIRFSSQLVTNFDNELKLNNYSKIKIGLILMNRAEEIKDAYAKYMQNHANITNLIKNYESNSEITQFINNRLNTLKDQVKVPNLQSLLIKPVQRIFKYPLFLKRIQENTEPTHCDYDNLNKSILVFTKVLEYINEYKRRRDLVNKYKQSHQIDYADITISDIFKKLTLKSIAKKTNRLSIQLTSKLGLFEQQVFDENFKRHEANFKFIESTSNRFLKDLNEYLENLREVIKNEATICNHLLYIFDDEFQTFLQFDTSANKRLKETFKQYYEDLRKSINLPGLELQHFFQMPNKLINKRNDKLTDYEGVLSINNSNNNNNGTTPTTPNATKEMSNRLNETKKDYEALNDQLIEELPKLTRTSSRILMLFIKKLIILTQDFNFKIKQELSTQKSILKFKSSSKSVVELLNHISFMHRHSSTSSHLYNLDALHRQSSILFDLVEESKQTEQDLLNLKQNYSPDNLFKVCKEYKANEKLRQLVLRPGDMVGLVKKYDPSGNTEVWFVDSGREKGFLPCDVLEASIQQPKTVGNLINFEEDLNESSNKNNLSTNENPFMLNILDEYCIAMFDFKAIRNNMIDLMEGKIYKVKEKCDKKLDPEWWLVESAENKVGYVPQCYIKLLD